MNNIISVTYKTGVKPYITKKSLISIAQFTLNRLAVQKNIEMGIVITDDVEIKELNTTYRHIDSSTDVLSFHMIPTEEIKLSIDFVTPPDEIEHIGEVIISYETAKLQSKDNRTTIKDELTFLLVHGILHLMNYDHINDTDRKIMEKKEKEIIEQLKHRGAEFT